jgi:hypothetical protein
MLQEVAAVDMLKRALSEGHFLSRVMPHDSQASLSCHGKCFFIDVYADDVLPILCNKISS